MLRMIPTLALLACVCLAGSARALTVYTVDVTAPSDADCDGNTSTVGNGVCPSNVHRADNTDLTDGTTVSYTLVNGADSFGDDTVAWYVAATGLVYSADDGGGLFSVPLSQIEAGGSLTFTTVRPTSMTSFTDDVIAWYDDMTGLVWTVDDNAGVFTIPLAMLLGTGSLTFTNVNSCANTNLCDDRVAWNDSATGLVYTVDGTTGNLYSIAQAAIGSGANITGTFTLENTPGNHNMTDDTVAFAVVPEPGTALLLASGLAGLAIAGRRDRI